MAIEHPYIEMETLSGDSARLPRFLIEDRARLLKDYERVRGYMEATVRRIEASPVEKKPSESDVDAYSKKIRELEKDHSVRMLELISARRLAKEYRRGLRTLFTATLSAASMAVAGIATAVASSVFHVDAGTAVMWLEVFGWPMTVLGTAATFGWQWMHRINIKWRKADSYPYDYVRDTVEYVDPQLNVEIAELNYSIALTRLTEHAGHRD